jgi:S-adenosylmethionine:tRNA-ribosyltransferase-isomerase (queuine synthetase)
MMIDAIDSYKKEEGGVIVRVGVYAIRYLLKFISSSTHILYFEAVSIFITPLI